MSEQNILDKLESAKMTLISISYEVEAELPQRYSKKLDTILGKLENLEWDIVDRQRKN